MRAITVTVKGSPPVVVSTGTRIGDLLPTVNSDGHPVLGAIANNMVVPLFMPLMTDATLTPLTIQDPHGWNIYRTSLCFLLANDRQRPQDARRITVHEHADDQQNQCQHGQKAIECVHPVSAHHPFCKPLSHDRSPFQAAEFDSCILSHVYEKYIKEL